MFDERSILILDGTRNVTLDKDMEDFFLCLSGLSSASQPFADIQLTDIPTRIDSYISQSPTTGESSRPGLILIENETPDDDSRYWCREIDLNLVRRTPSSHPSDQLSE